MRNWDFWRWGLMGAVTAAVLMGGGYTVLQSLGQTPQVARISGEDCGIGETEERSCSCSSGSGVQTRSCTSDNNWGSWGSCKCSVTSGGGNPTGSGSGSTQCREGASCTKTVGGVRCSGKKACISSTEFDCVLDDPTCGKSANPSASPAKAQCKTNADCASVGVGAICDTTGKCMDPGGPVGCGSSTDGSCNGSVVREPGGSSYCDSQGRRCSQVRVECKASNGDHCFLRSEEQCGAPGSCGGGTRTTPRPSQSVSPSASPQISLACTGIAKNITEPTLGETVQLTCAGTVVPTGATSLSYEFRYRINQGSWQSLVTVGNKANLVIEACGTYAAQCRVCGTVGGVKQCSPVWSGAAN